MKKSRFTEGQIIAAIKESEAGAKTPDICRKLGISSATFYKWKVGSTPRPGEVTLASRGVLYLDEIAEFPRATLEVLRQPLEDGRVTIARAAGSWTFPARFALVASMNPCPCGRRGERRRLPLRRCRRRALPFARVGTAARPHRSAHQRRDRALR